MNSTFEPGTRVVDVHYPRKGTVVSAPIMYSYGSYASRNILVDWDDMSRRWVNVTQVRAFEPIEQVSMTTCDCVQLICQHVNDAWH